MASSRPRAVLDTNVVLRIILSRKPGGVASAIWQLLQEGRFEVVTSKTLLEELRDTLGVPELADIHGWSAEQVEDYVEALSEIALTVPGTTAVDVPRLAQRDASDLPFVAAAVEAKAVIVTQDADLLDLAGSGELPDLKILDPLDFLRRLRAFQE